MIQDMQVLCAHVSVSSTVCMLISTCMYTSVLRDSACVHVPVHQSSDTSM